MFPIFLDLVFILVLNGLTQAPRSRYVLGRLFGTVFQVQIQFEKLLHFVELEGFDLGGRESLLQFMLS